MDPEDPDSYPDHSLLPFQTYPEDFIKIRPSVFGLSCSQSNSQTHKPRQKHNLLGKGNKT